MQKLTGLLVKFWVVISFSYGPGAPMQQGLNETCQYRNIAASTVDLQVPESSCLFHYLAWNKNADWKFQLLWLHICAQLTRY